MHTINDTLHYPLYSQSLILLFSSYLFFLVPKWHYITLFFLVSLVLILLHERQIGYYQTTGPYFDVIIPYRYASRLWGKLAYTEIPVWLRKPLYSSYAYLFGCNLDEMGQPLESYKCLGEFFARPLKPGLLWQFGDDVIFANHFLGVRTFSPTGIASPVDGIVVSFGKLDGETIEQVKGLTYTLSEFLTPASSIPNDAGSAKKCVITFLVSSPYSSPLGNSTRLQYI